jgi:hypothetical protein
LAEIEARTGRPEEAVKILRQLLTAPTGEVVSIARLKIDPVLGPNPQQFRVSKTSFRTRASDRLQLARDDAARLFC